MGLHVSVVRRGVMVTSSAHVALEVTGFVLATVTVERRAVLETLTAAVTHVWSLTSVGAQMLFQAALSGKHFATLVAGDGGGSPVVFLLVSEQLTV